MDRTIYRRHAIGLAALATLALTVAGCSTGSGNSSENNSGDGTVKIAFVPGSTTAQFYVSMKAGAEEAAKELGVELVYQGASEFSPADQTPIVNALAAQDIDALVIAPTDQESMFAPINALHQAGVKIVTVDTTLKDTSIVAAEVSASNEQGGALAADHLGELLGQDAEGTVAILGLNPGATTINARAQGFSDRIAEVYPGLTVLPTEYVSGTDPSDAQTKTEALLLAHSNLVGVFAPNQPAGEGAAAGLRSQGITDVPVIGYDSSERQVALLKEGSIDALVLQQPALEGRLAVEAAYAAVTDEEFEASQLLDNVLATTENVEDPEIVRYFY